MTCSTPCIEIRVIHAGDFIHNIRGCIHSTGYQLMAVAIDETASYNKRFEAIDELYSYPFYVRSCHPQLVTLSEDRDLSTKVTELVLGTYSYAELVEMLCSSSKTKKFHPIFSLGLIESFNTIDHAEVRPFEPYVRSLIANDPQHRGEAMLYLQRFGCLRPDDAIWFHIYLLFGNYEERCAAVISLHAARYRNHLLMSSAIALLPLPERGGEKMDLLEGLKHYGVLAKNALPSARKLLYDGQPGVQTDAIWLLKALEHHSIGAVPRLVALSLAFPKQNAGQQAYLASVSIIKSWILFQIRWFH